MKAYQNKKTGVILRSETYNELLYSEKRDFVEIQAQEKSDGMGGFILSAVVGSFTDSALLGGLIGGSLFGGIVGDMLDGDLFD